MHDTEAGRPVGDRRSSGWRALVRLLRPRQWIKNGFVLAPLLFTGLFLDPAAVGRAAFATLLFCLAAAAVYVFNDLRDIESDRRHPHKALLRPLAAGTVSRGAAQTLLAVLLAAVLAGGLLVPAVGGVILAYLVLNFAYTLHLKHQPVLDIFCIAFGFVLRVYAGAMALAVPVSTWMFVTTLCLALYLAAVKRRQELRQHCSEARASLARYPVALVDRYAEMSATGALVFYSMFVMSARPELVITVPVVLFGLYRYWYVVEVNEGGESPTDVVLTDRTLLVTLAVWLATCAWALWPAGRIS